MKHTLVAIINNSSQGMVTKASTAMHSFIKHNRHLKLNKLIAAIKVKLRGHYLFYGITHNYLSIARFYGQVRRILYKWLRRRGAKPGGSIRLKC